MSAKYRSVFLKKNMPVAKSITAAMEESPSDCQPIDPVWSKPALAALMTPVIGFSDSNHAYFPAMLDG